MNCLDFNPRFWITHGSVVDRIPMVRLMLSTHRMVIETGRWKRWPREERICTTCKSRDKLFICHQMCIHDDQKCLGTEAHYLWFCPLTSWVWDLAREQIRSHAQFDIGHNFTNLNKLSSDYKKIKLCFTRHQIRTIVSTLAKMASRVLKDGSGVDMPYNIARIRSNQLGAALARPLYPDDDLPEEVFTEEEAKWFL